jgi:hypothetical protein
MSVQAMQNISDKRCFNHNAREAVALCPECRRFFCRECITEHADRVICAACLRDIALGSRQRVSGRRVFFRSCQCALGFITLWLVFYAVGRGLLRLPTSFHEGALWRDTPRELP